MKRAGFDKLSLPQSDTPDWWIPAKTDSLCLVNVQS